MTQPTLLEMAEEIERLTEGRIPLDRASWIALYIQRLEGGMTHEQAIAAEEQEYAERGQPSPYQPAAPQEASTYTPPTMDEWWAIVDALNSIDIGAATLEGGGAACTFIQIETNGGELINFGDVNETWTADVYANLSDWQQGHSCDGFDTEVPTSNRNADDIANAYLAAWQKWSE